MKDKRVNYSFYILEFELKVYIESKNYKNVGFFVKCIAQLCSLESKLHLIDG